MLSPVCKRSVYLPLEVWDALGVMASQRGTSRAQVIRAALENFVEFSSPTGPNHKRLAELCEFNQLVLDLIVKRDFSDRREEILDVVDERIGQYHG